MKESKHKKLTKLITQIIERLEKVSNILDTESETHAAEVKAPKKRRAKKAN